MKKSTDLSEYEYSEKLKIKAKLEKDTSKKIDGKSLKSFDKINKYMKSINYFFSRGIINAHLDFEPIAQKIANKKSFYIISGRNPSGSLHLGHLALFKLLLEFQKLGANIIIPFTNDESYIDGKTKDFETGKNIAMQTIPFLAALGFNPNKTKVLIHTDYIDLYRIAMYFGNFININQLNSLFGQESTNTPSKIFYRGALQLASILMLQLKEFGGKQNVLVPVSLDQHPYILLARDVAKKSNLIPPSEIVIPFLLGNKNPLEKMSSSIEGSAIRITDSPDKIRKLINQSYTGSLSTLDGHKLYGAIPEICPVFQILRYLHEDDDYISNLQSEYREGLLLTSELKSIVTKFLIRMTTDLQSKAEEFDKKYIEMFLLKTLISSK